MTLALLTLALAVGSASSPARDDGARPEIETRAGAFVGTLVAVDGGSLVVRGDTGQAVTFLLDGRSSMPAGFVAGARVLVRYAVLPDRTYWAASVSPPRIPQEPDAVSELPPWPEPEPAAASTPQGDPGGAPSSDREPVPAPEAPHSAVDTLVTYPRPPVEARASARAAATRPMTPRRASPIPSFPSEPTAEPTLSPRPIGDPPSAQGAHRAWLPVVAALLVAGAVLGWRAYTRP